MAESYQYLFELTPAMLHSIDANGIILNASNLWLSKMGYSRNEVVGRPSTDFLTEESRHYAKTIVLPDFFKTGKVNGAEYDLVTKAGEILQVRLDAVFYTHPKTGVQQSIAVLTDLREEKRLIRELELRHAASALTSKMAALGEMAGGIAHEINNPLTIIHGKAAQIRKGLKSKSLDLSAIDENSEMIEETTMRIATIIKGLKSFARDSSSDPSIRIPVKTVLSDVLMLCKSRFQNHHIELTILPFPDDLEMVCRPVEISQVLLNLLSNSFDAVQGQPHPKVWIQVSRKESEIEFSVQDNGSGVSPELIGRIMDPFFTTKPVGQGTGLGLSIAKGIVESHKGTLALKQASNPTIFSFTLPT